MATVIEKSVPVIIPVCLKCAIDIWYICLGWLWYKGGNLVIQETA